MNKRLICYLVAALCLLSVHSVTIVIAEETAKTTKINVPQSYVGAQLVMLAAKQALEMRIKLRQLAFKLPAAKAKLFIKQDGKIVAAIGAKNCSKNKKTGKLSCTTKIQTEISSGADLGKIKSSGASGLLVSSTKKAKLASGTKYSAATLALSVASHGRSNSATSSTKKRGRVKIRDVGGLSDSDGDALPDAIDSDDDGDGKIDNYDPSTPASSLDSASFKIFSNFKVNLEQTVNVNTGVAPSQSDIDMALANNGTLAIQVAGKSGETTELDCTGLDYCSSGGTGRSNGQQFPDQFDADGDGYGTITSGPTGDFQLMHGATSSTIGSGDAFLERVTDSADKETQVPGLLNFTFYSTPALKSIQFGTDTPIDISYPTTPSMPGTANNCFQAPIGWDGTITVTGWRPQRKGDTSLEEADTMDIGGSLFTIDVPNAPCSAATSGGCSTTRSGNSNCAASTYSIPGGETNLTVGSDTLVDNAADSASNSANTFSFKTDITACLGSTSFNPSEKLFLDLQARSRDGDNAAVKFCIRK